MILSKVIGNVTSSVKHSAYKGKKILIVTPLDDAGKTNGKSFLAIDAVQAGVGDIVLAAREGNTARQILGDLNAPLHSVIVGIVDHIAIT
jgi:microcompartment protein CcmK/EutM